MRRRFFLIFNPSAGTSRLSVVRRLAADLEAAGATIVWSEATTAAASRNEARAAASSGNYDAVIAAGGDGTVRQAAAALAGSDCPLGAVMLGTGNVLAHELALPRQVPALANLLLTGPTRSVRLAEANGEPFLLMAGAGFDGRIMGALDQRLKQRIAKAAFVPSVLKTLAGPLDDLTVQLDGDTLKANWAIIARARHYGGAFVLTARTHVFEDGLVAILFQSRSKARLVLQLLALARGRLDARALSRTPDVIVRPCAAAHITASNPVPVQIDGDDFGTTPLHVTLATSRVRLIVPPPPATSS